MEAAERVFAQEYNAAVMSDGENGPVITPLGARCSRIFIVGALTDVKGRAGGPVQARIADPTGTFLVRIPPREELIAEQVVAFPIPSFVSVLGRCRLFQRGQIREVSITPETINLSGKEIRDLWVERTASRTLGRIETILGVLDGGKADARLEDVIRRYHTDRNQLGAMTKMILLALRSIGGRGGEAPPQTDPKAVLLAILTTPRDPPLFPLEELLAKGMEQGQNENELLRALEALLQEGECYMPRNGVIKMA